MENPRESKYEFRAIIDQDINKIDKVLSKENSYISEQKDLHTELDGKYQSVIKNWGQGMYGWNKEFGFIDDFIGTSYEYNLKLMKAKMETYKFGMNEVISARSGVTINNIVNNEVRVDVYFENARDKINNMPGLTYDETKEIIDRINEIEKIIYLDENKKKKWELLKPIAKWTLDKGVDVAVSLLPLIMRIQ